MKTILVTGGAGYIGSNTVVELLKNDYQVVVLDNLYNASEEVLPRIAGIAGKKPIFEREDCRDKAALRSIFARHRIDAVIHFAGLKAVGESCRKPLEYYENNLVSTLALLQVMGEFGCRQLVFSSSATVYGDSQTAPFTEDMPALQSSNPYGWTKVMIERIITDYAAAHPDFSALLLRYFNPIGADDSGLLGDNPAGIPNNLMPFLTQAAAGEREKLIVFGNDYPTPDGTCVRDYLHVVDLARGHLSALAYTAEHTGVLPVNLGTGKGLSVLELINAFETATGTKVPYEIGARREGDLPAVWADCTRARELLHWQAVHTVEDMCLSSWNFTKKNRTAAT